MCVWIIASSSYKKEEKILDFQSFTLGTAVAFELRIKYTKHQISFKNVVQLKFSKMHYSNGFLNLKISILLLVGNFLKFRTKWHFCGNKILFNIKSFGDRWRDREGFKSHRIISKNPASFVTFLKVLHLIMLSNRFYRMTRYVKPQPNSNYSNNVWSNMALVKNDIRFETYLHFLRQNTYLTHFILRKGQQIMKDCNNLIFKK